MPAPDGVPGHLAVAGLADGLGDFGFGLRAADGCAVQSGESLGVGVDVSALAADLLQAARTEPNVDYISHAPGQNLIGNHQSAR